MRKMTITGAALASALMMIGGGTTAAVAAETAPDSATVREGSASADRSSQTRNGTEYVGGGTWTYGVWDKEVHSIFVTDRSTHRASVRSKGVLQRSAWMAPTKIANAHREKAASGNQSFWATRG